MMTNIQSILKEIRYAKQGLYQFQANNENFSIDPAVFELCYFHYKETGEVIIPGIAFDPEEPGGVQIQCAFVVNNENKNSTWEELFISDSPCEISDAYLPMIGADWATLNSTYTPANVLPYFEQCTAKKWPVIYIHLGGEK